MLGYGKVTSIGYEGCDEYIQSSKMNGKTISVENKQSGDFIISVKSYISGRQYNAMNT